MAIFKNEFGEDRVVPHLGYILVPAGATVTVPDDEAHHWEAGGWAPVGASPKTTKTTTPAVAPATPEGTAD